MIPEREPLPVCLGINSDIPHLNSLQPCMLQQVKSTEWKPWKNTNVFAKDKTVPITFELILEAGILVQNFKETISVLVDTGCRIPLLFRQKLVPPDLLEKATRSIQIKTADNTPMVGGTHGCKMILTLPVNTDRADDKLSFVMCQPCWGYECALFGSDVIIGYPFLKIFYLTVDCPADTLRCTYSKSDTSASSKKRNSATASSMTPTDVFYTDERKPAWPTTRQVMGSKPSIVPPGSKTNVPRPQDIVGSSSYPAETQPAVSGVSMTPLQFVESVRIPTGPSVTASTMSKDLGIASVELESLSVTARAEPSGQDVTVSTTLPLLSNTFSLGVTASSNTSLPSTPLFQCKHCRRLILDQNYDCCIGDHTPKRTAEQQCCTSSVGTVDFTPGITPPYTNPGNPVAIESVSVIPTTITDDWFKFCPKVFQSEEQNTCSDGTTGFLVRSFLYSPGDTGPPVSSCESTTLSEFSQDGKLRLTPLLKSANYRVISSVFQEILQAAELQGVIPEVDAFSSRAHARLPEYWSAHSDAFNKYWNEKVLWINPPVAHLSRIVEKIFREEARGIILIPVWPESDWFIALLYVAIHWWDLPRDTVLFESPRGKPLSPDLFPSFRVILFDAYQSVQTFTDLPHNVEEDFCVETPLLQHIVRSVFPDAETCVQVSSAIESASPHPQSKLFDAELRRRYEDVMEHPVYAKDIDPAIRGPFGVAKIELKEGAKPMHKKFFRCSGEREIALKAMIEKFISRGWVIPSKSEWTSQAFVVPKPADKAGNKQWRLVLDYRYLNSQTKDDPYPLPLIEVLESILFFKFQTQTL